jgi:hypothetical protein
VAGTSEHVNEHSGKMKGWEFLDWLNNYQLLSMEVNVFRYHATYFSDLSYLILF